MRKRKELFGMRAEPSLYEKATYGKQNWMASGDKGNKSRQENEL